MKTSAIAIAALLLAAACTKEESGQPSADSSAAAAPAAAPAAKFALADFQHLRYLEGKWRGTMPNGKTFYESYHFVNDSTILQAGHTDSTFKTKSDSSVFMFRGGAVIDSSSTIYHATKLDATSVDFRADPSPKHGFVWTREHGDAWTARIIGTNPDGTERVSVYPMKRIP